MGGNKDLKFSKEDFDKFFTELDADGSGTVDKEEMFRFVRVVCGLPVEAIKIKTPRTLGKEKNEYFKRREEEEN